jgi:hypothetical protein
MSHDVTLPARQKPLFSNRCVVCECENPNAIAEITVLVSTQQQGLVDDAIDLALNTQIASGNRNISIQVPACLGCKSGLKQWHFWRMIFQYAGPLLGVALFVLAIYKGVTFLGVAALIVGILAPVIYEMFKPPAFNTTGSGSKLIYEFGSPTCAAEFKQLNLKEENAG